MRSGAKLSRAGKTRDRNASRKTSLPVRGACSHQAGQVQECGKQVVAGAGFALGPRAGVKRHLVRRTIKYRGIVPENVLRAVAVVHVPIDDGDAVGLVPPLRIAGRISQASVNGLEPPPHEWPFEEHSQ